MAHGRICDCCGSCGPVDGDFDLPKGWDLIGGDDDGDLGSKDICDVCLKEIIAFIDNHEKRK